MELSNNFKSKFSQTSSGDWRTKEDRIALGILFVLIGFFLLYFGWSDRIILFLVTGSLSSLWGIILFTKTETLTINKSTGALVSEKRWAWKSRTKEYPKDSTYLMIHPTSVQNPRGIDWKGFGLTLSYGDKKMMIARMKDQSKLEEYALSLSDKMDMKIPNQSIEPIVKTPFDIGNV